MLLYTRLKFSKKFNIYINLINNIFKLIYDQKNSHNYLILLYKLSFKINFIIKNHYIKLP
jgi:hypothetical protein